MLKQSANNKISVNQKELSTSRILLVSIVIVYFTQFIVSTLSIQVNISNILVLSVIGILSLVIYITSYKNNSIQVILASKQYLLYLYFFTINHLVMLTFGDAGINSTLSIGIILIGITNAKNFLQLIIFMVVGLSLHLLCTGGQFSIVFLTFYIGVTALQIVKLTTNRRYLESEKSIGGIFSNLSEPLIMANKKTMIIDYCNRYATDILRSKEKIENQNIKLSTLIAPNSCQKFMEVIKQLNSGALVNWKGEIELQALNNEKIWVLFNINIVRFPNDEKFVVKITDISQIKSYEGKLRKSLEESEASNIELGSTKRAIVNVMEDLQVERDKAYSLADDLEKFKLAVENASDSIVITDPEGITLYANSSVVKLTGYTKEEVIGSNPEELWASSMGENFSANLWDVIKIQKKTFEGEIQNKRKNGEIYYAQLSVSPILNTKGDVEFFVGIIKDITKSKEIDKVRSEFVSVASHQLRTPLTSIKWYIELIQEDDKNLTDAQKDIFKEIAASNNRMISLVNDLLNVSRIETGEKYKMEKKWENIITLLKTVLQDQQIIAENKKIKIYLDNGGFEEFMMSFDRPKLYQAVANLINNAIKYSRNDSTIDLSFRQNGDNEVLISVIDHGIGIPEEGKNRVFQKFYRAENAIKIQTDGTGLGLYFTKSVVVDHGGNISFDSIEGLGTTFIIKLPIR